MYRFDISTEEVKEIFRIETAAILDMKWLTNLPEPVLAAANAIGQIKLYKLDNESLNLIEKKSLNERDDNLLALCLDWNEESKQIAVSDSHGSIWLYKLQDGLLEEEGTWSAHNFEAWICAFDDWNSNVLYTGGDDTMFHTFDIRCPKEAFKTSTNKSHLAGVTCFLSHPKRENCLLTGSYDEKLRYFDTRSLKQPVAEINLGGGIWRIKSNPFDSNMILTACMYHNFSVVKLMEHSSNFLLTGVLEEHSSICYGSDWNYQSGLDYNFYTATCSFYDHKLCLCKWNFN